MRHRRRVPATPMVAITSMMDMFTIILVFLLNFLDPAATVPGDLALPKARTIEPIEGELVLMVTRESVRIGGVDVVDLVAVGGAPAVSSAEGRSGRRIDRLYDALTAKRDESKGQTGTLVVQCDRGVPFSVVGDVLYTAGQAGFGQFRFVVISDPG